MVSSLGVFDESGASGSERVRALWESIAEGPAPTERDDSSLRSEKLGLSVWSVVLRIRTACGSSSNVTLRRDRLAADTLLDVEETAPDGCESSWPSEEAVERRE